MSAIPTAAQQASTSSTLVSPEASSNGNAAVTGTLPQHPSASLADRPFSRIALGAGISPLGIQLQVATNLNRYMNARATGSFFNYTMDNISTNGFDVSAQMNLASVGASLDLYPFPRHGLRFSPGILFRNTNEVSGTFTAEGGTSFTLNDYTYYSSPANPVRGNGVVGLHTQNPAFTMTTGWGNVIPRKGSHFAFPFEIGAAFIGAPTVDVALTSGQVCDAQGQNCLNVATDADVQQNLRAQVAKYKNDLDPLKTYPILSFGVAYNFRVRSGSVY